LYKPKRVIDDPDMDWGLCLWQLPDGTYVQDDDGNYLSCGPCKIGNKKAMKNMIAAIRSLGVTTGKPFWLPGFRKISDSEHDDQMERLLEGRIPDAADLYRQAVEEHGKSV
jgi:hypothetical protein